MAQPSAEASAVDQEGEQRAADAKKGRKAKKKGRAAAIQQAELTGSTSTKRSVIMDPSKGELQPICLQKSEPHHRPPERYHALEHHLAQLHLLAMIGNPHDVHDVACSHGADMSVEF